MEFLSGSEVIVRGAMTAGCKAFFGYPITPSSEIMALMSEELPKVGGVFRQMEDEIAASAAAIGASWAGAKAMTATSGPGFSLMQENIGMATMLEIPLVVLNAQRIGPSTGIPTIGSQQDLMQAIWGRHGDQSIVVLSPSNFSEMFSMTIRAFNASEMLRTPVVLLTDGHMVTLRSSVDIRGRHEVVSRKALHSGDAHMPFRTDDSLVPGFPPVGQGLNVPFDTLCHDERGHPTSDRRRARALIIRLKEKLVKNIDLVWAHEESGPVGSKEIVVSYGSSAISARHAVERARDSGRRTSLLVLKCIWPLKEDVLRNALRGKKRVILVEQANGQLRWLIGPFTDDDAELVEVPAIGRPPSPLRVLEAIEREA
jgi:2-oxoglutarate ferredoxin oxidoreductase subunit alpha